MPDMASMLSKEWFSSISTNTFLMGNASLTLPLVIVSVLTPPERFKVTIWSPICNCITGVLPALLTMLPPIHQLFLEFLLPCPM